MSLCASVLTIDWRLLLLALVILLWIFHRCTQAWAAWRRSILAVKRSSRAQQGEHDAEALLETEGYIILDRQLSTIWTLECDGEEWDVDLRADLLVEKDGQQFIAEVKTGDRAPNLGNAATRRQMLEYAIAYDSPTVLLVDVERDSILPIQFFLPDTESLAPPSSLASEHTQRSVPAN